MSGPQYQWHGESVHVEFGFCDVSKNEEKPMWWHNYECRAGGSARTDALKVSTKEKQTFVIANHFGIGAYKLLLGGWPNIGHFSLPAGSFVGSSAREISEFDREAFMKHEEERSAWQKENFPEEWKLHESLSSIINKSKGHAIR